MSDTRPWRKVVYSANKPNTKSRWFVLLECGHFWSESDCKHTPTKRRCSDCEYTHTLTVERLYFEHQAMERGYWHLQQTMEKLKDVTHVTD